MAPRVIMAGAGIGGLAAALALARAGWSVAIYERAAALEEFGAGLQLTPNATRVLARLGLLDSMRQFATAPKALRILRSRDNAELVRMPLDDAERRWGAPYLAMHRADLQRVLLEAVKRQAHVTLTLGAQIVEANSAADGVGITFKRGGAIDTDCADVLIGADGLRSVVRANFGIGASDGLAFSGSVAFRAAVDVTKIDSRWGRADVYLRLGPKAHLVHYPLRGGAIVNLVAVIDSNWLGAATEHPWDGIADRPTLDRAFAQWSDEARSIIAAAPNWRAWPLFARPPLKSFSSGRVALVGDAAHPMAPFLAQGAAQAIEDAGALARRLFDASDIPSALDAYSRDRVARATRVQTEASGQARVYHASGAVALARDMAVRVLGPERLAARYDWLYGS